MIKFKSGLRFISNPATVVPVVLNNTVSLGSVSERHSTDPERQRRSVVTAQLGASRYSRLLIGTVQGDEKAINHTMAPRTSDCIIMVIKHLAQNQESEVSAQEVLESCKGPTLRTLSSVLEMLSRIGAIETESSALSLKTTIRILYGNHEAWEQHRFHALFPNAR